MKILEGLINENVKVKFISALLLHSLLMQQVKICIYR